MFIKATVRSKKKEIGKDPIYTDHIIMLNTNHIASVLPSKMIYPKNYEYSKTLITMTTRENDCYYVTESVREIRLQFQAVNMSTELIMAEVAS